MKADELPSASRTSVPLVRAGTDVRRLGDLHRWAAGFIRPERGALARVLGLSLLAVLAGLAQPLLTRALIDDGILARDASRVLATGGWMVALALAALAVGFSCRRVHVGASARILHRMREALFAHVLTLPPDYFARTRQGDLLARLEGDLGEVQRFAVNALLSAVNSVLTLVGTVLLLGLLSPKLALLLAVLMAVNAVVLSRVRPRIEALSRQSRDAGVEVSSFLVEKTAAVRCIQTHVAEARELSRLESLHAVLRERLLAAQLWGYLGGAFPNLLLSLAVIGIFVIGSLAMLSGDPLTLGTLVAFAACVQRASAPLHALMGLYLQWQRVKVALVRVDELRAVPAPRADGDARADGPLPAGDLVVSGLACTHAGAGRAAFSGLAFTVPAGARVWLRGPSGCGKSTFIDVLQRLIGADAGQVSLAGMDLRCIPRPLLRRHLVVVSQEAVLFTGTLSDNIRYGRPGASDDEVSAAAAAAGVDAFAARLPDGLLTRVGPRGASLSGGERQRVALARALLMQPAILVIDEGTSSLDGALEARALAAVDAMLPGATRIVVSHRALDPAHFDRVIDFPAGGAP